MVVGLSSSGVVGAGTDLIDGAGTDLIDGAVIELCHVLRLWRSETGLLGSTTVVGVVDAVLGAALDETETAWLLVELVDAERLANAATDSIGGGEAGRLRTLSPWLDVARGIMAESSMPFP